MQAQLVFVLFLFFKNEGPTFYIYSSVHGVLILQLFGRQHFFLLFPFIYLFI